MPFLGVYGHLNVDYILQLARLPQAETTVPVERSLYRMGGTGGNIARAAAALGVPTSLAACVGDDFPPEFMASLRSAGLDLADLRHVPGSTPKVWLLSVPGGPQSAVIDQGVMGDGVQRPALDLAWLDATWVHFTTGPTQEWLRAAQGAHDARKRITFDPAQELSYRWTSRDFERLLGQSDLFIANEAEVQRALALMSYGDPVQLLDHTDHVIVTRGAQGARFYAQGERFEMPACPPRDVARPETTGAGDVYRAGLYAALHRGRAWKDALRTAAVASSLFLETGGERFPTWPDVEARARAWSA